MRIHSFLLAALVLVTAGCNDPLKSSGSDWGVITVPTYSDGGAGFVISPLALFYENENFGYTPPTAGACGTLRFNPDESVTIGGTRTMDVGPHLVARLPAREDTLHRSTEFGFSLYKVGSLGGVPHQPGDTLMISIPRSPKFPESAISIRTAEAFSLGPVPVPEVNTPATVTWTGAAAPGTVMRISLRYAAEPATGALNQQVVCFFEDDGSGTFEGSILQGWVSSVGGLRQVSAMRIRANEVEASSGKRITMISTFESPPPTLAP